MTDYDFIAAEPGRFHVWEMTDTGIFDAYGDTLAEAEANLAEMKERAANGSTD